VGDVSSTVDGVTRSLAIGVALSLVLLGVVVLLTRETIELDAFGAHYSLAAPHALRLLAALPIVLALAARSLADLPRTQLVLSAIARAAVLTALVLAAAQPVRTSDQSRVAVAFLVDVSDSLRDEAIARAQIEVRSAIEALPSDGEAFVITFAADAHRVRLDRDHPEMLVLARHDDGSATDLAGALRLAAAVLPPDHLGRIVVFSDGAETEPGALAESSSLEARGIHVFSSVATEGAPPDVGLVGVDLPPEVHVGERFIVRVHARATLAQHVRLRLYQNELLNGLEGTREIDLPRGETEIELPSIVHVAGPVTYRATITPSDASSNRFTENDTLDRTIVVPGRPRVLYVEAGPSSSYLSRALEAAELDVEVRTPRAFPTSLDELSAFDFVILSDTPADAIPSERQALIERYVRTGGGFLMAGGAHGFGLGGWEGERLERSLPVRMAPERRRDQPSLALALVIDRSGSMAGDKIELAKEAARATADLLSADDSLGVIGFDSVPERIVRMQSAGNRVAIQRDIGRLAARGGTAIFPALDMALSDLSVTRARLRHVILLTDGQTQEPGIDDLVSLMRGEGITISTVGIGSDVNRALLEEVADAGGGRAYFTSDAHNIPRIFTHETTTAMQNGAVEDYVAAHLVTPAAFLRTVPLDAAPLLRGYVATQMRAAPAEQILRSDLGEPLLARMHVGLGWTLAWTSDVTNRWAVDWVRWSGFSPFFGGLVREHMRERHAEELPIEASMRGDVARVVIDALDEGDAFVNDLDSIAHLVGPMSAPVAERTTIDVPLAQVAPGRYEGETRLPRFGAYAIAAEHRRDGAVVAQSTGSVVYPFAPEYAALEPNGDLLTALDMATGGRSYGAASDVFDTRDEHLLGREDVRPPFFLAALALFVVDLLLRRVRLFDRGFRRSRH
jgi:uncharacterized membrane protein/uncharacterized protein YegL